MHPNLSLIHIDVYKRQGFRCAVDKKGLRFEKRNTTLTVSFKPPIELDQSMSVEEIIERIRKEIEQEIPYDTMKWMKGEGEG